MVLLDVSSNNFLQKHDFDHTDLVLFKRLSREILFSDFVYLLLDRITNSKKIKNKRLMAENSWRLTEVNLQTN